MSEGGEANEREFLEGLRYEDKFPDEGREAQHPAGEPGSKSREDFDKLVSRAAEARARGESHVPVDEGGEARNHEAEVEAVALAIYESRLHTSFINGWRSEPEALRERFRKAALAALDAVRCAQGRDTDAPERSPLARIVGKTHTDAIRAAREVDSLFDGEGPGRWTYAGKRITDEAAEPLLSMHDYLNTLAYHAPRSPQGEDHEAGWPLDQCGECGRKGGDGVLLLISDVTKHPPLCFECRDLWYPPARSPQGEVEAILRSVYTDEEGTVSSRRDVNDAIRECLQILAARSPQGEDHDADALLARSLRAHHGIVPAPQGEDHEAGIQAVARVIWEQQTQQRDAGQIAEAAVAAYLGELLDGETK